MDYLCACNFANAAQVAQLHAFLTAHAAQFTRWSACWPSFARQAEPQRTFTKLWRYANRAARQRGGEAESALSRRLGVRVSLKHPVISFS